LSTKSSIQFISYPRTEPPPEFVYEVVEAFRKREPLISTLDLPKGLTSDQVLAVLRDDLTAVGFEVEAGKEKAQKIGRPVFYGSNGVPTLRYEIDAYHTDWRCGLEIEAGRGWMGNAVYRDLVQAMVMVQVDFLILAVSNYYKYKSGGRETVSRDFENTRNLAEALYGHSRFTLPYSLIIIGY
jgi:hypothetical protein